MATVLKQEDITADFIIETAERVGIKLVPRMYLDRVNRCGCAVTVLAFAVDPDLANAPGAVSSASVFETLNSAGLTDSFLCGLINGFDGYRFDESWSKHDNHHVGWNVGRAARQKFDPKFAAGQSGEAVA